MKTKTRPHSPHRLLGVFLSLALCLSLLPTAAFAAIGNEINKNTSTWTGGTKDAPVTYQVQAVQTVTITSRVEVAKKVILELNGGILVCEQGIHVPKGASLTIQDSSTGQTGVLYAGMDTNETPTMEKPSSTIVFKSETGHAGIGSNQSEQGAGEIIIESGTINAHGGNGVLLEIGDTVTVGGGAGIGGGFKAATPTITIKGGTVTAIGDGGVVIGKDDLGYGGAGIGSGTIGTSSSIEITNGIVNATGVLGGAGIGGGYGSGSGSITISGGQVTATSQASRWIKNGGAGIGSGAVSSNVSNDDKIEIKDSASVNANAMNGKANAIGGGGGTNSAPQVTVGGNNVFVNTTSTTDATAFPSNVTRKEGGIVADNGVITKDTVIGDNANITIPKGITITVPKNVSLTVNKGATINNNGSLNNSGILNNSGTLTGSGSISNQQGGSLSNSGTLVNNNQLVNTKGSTLTNEGGGKMEVNGLIENNGAINNEGNFTNNGTINNNDTSKPWEKPGTINNNGNGTLTNNGTIHNDGNMKTDISENIVIHGIITGNDIEGYNGPSAQSPFKLAGIQVGLTDRLVVHFTVSIPYGYKKPTASFTVNNVSTNAKLTEKTSPVLWGENSLYECSLTLTAKQMTDPIKLSVTAKDIKKVVTGEVISAFTVKQHLQTLLNDPKAPAGQRELVSALLRYGTEAQKYFSYNPTNLADTGVTGMTLKPATVTITGFADPPANPSAGGEEQLPRFVGSTLLLNDQVSIRHYFKFDTVSTGGYKINGAGALTAAPPSGNTNSSDGYFYVDGGTRPVTQWGISTDVTVTSPKGQVTTIPYSVMAYCQQMQNDADFAPLAQAMYQYYTAAKAYSGQ